MSRTSFENNVNAFCYISTEGEISSHLSEKGLPATTVKMDEEGVVRYRSAGSDYKEVAYVHPGNLLERDKDAMEKWSDNAPHMTMLIALLKIKDKLPKKHADFHLHIGFNFDKGNVCISSSCSDKTYAQKINFRNHDEEPFIMSNAVGEVVAILNEQNKWDIAENLETEAEHLRILPTVFDEVLKVNQEIKPKKAVRLATQYGHEVQAAIPTVE